MPNNKKLKRALKKAIQANASDETVFHKKGEDLINNIPQFFSKVMHVIDDRCLSQIQKQHLDFLVELSCQIGRVREEIRDPINAYLTSDGFGTESISFEKLGLDVNSSSFGVLSDEFFKHLDKIGNILNVDLDCAVEDQLEALRDEAAELAEAFVWHTNRLPQASVDQRILVILQNKALGDQRVRKLLQIAELLIKDVDTFFASLGAFLRQFSTSLSCMFSVKLSEKPSYKKGFRGRA